MSHLKAETKFQTKNQRTNGNMDVGEEEGFANDVEEPFINTGYLHLMVWRRPMNWLNIVVSSNQKGGYTENAD
ncbi:hypothetical protein SPOG_02548 [Schizosaccharomyces cryophilus OY26]|uniref:Uncharacterized protein n=1 Tax=Schizosaccharomyces cryophilus (strain OY26 / ATCC MYA-4695 / CBS 11777 / NBRC 106824 / NRRL Y48691) TaxID=653667 RepID=S9W038_SCHCR|nr:uncharacterized protein SPOG_02548 [Schizosaccharomyces cryophilus OY26]EPY51375.1 hypothetical protein SPOG_02548 [Schizosaccharomyces cryophilus OY26]